jgi:undecaprenyl-diphosphatase
MVEWLNTAFYGLDRGAFSIVNSLAQTANGFFAPISAFMAVLGSGGISFIIISVILMLFKKTRKTGFTMLVAIGIGALFTNVIIKNAVARQRPYTQQEYKDFWQYVGCNTEGEFSFPSGHVTVTMTSMTALFLTVNKKWSWLGFILALVMGFTRVYLIVHYLTDVLAGLMVGAIAGIIAYFICKYLFNVVEKHKHKKSCEFMLNAEIINLFKKDKKEQ